MCLGVVLQDHDRSDNAAHCWCAPEPLVSPKSEGCAESAVAHLVSERYLAVRNLHDLHQWKSWNVASRALPANRFHSERFFKSCRTMALLMTRESGEEGRRFFHSLSSARLRRMGSNARNDVADARAPALFLAPPAPGRQIALFERSRHLQPTDMFPTKVCAMKVPLSKHKRFGKAICVSRSSGGRLFFTIADE